MINEIKIYYDGMIVKTTNEIYYCYLALWNLSTNDSKSILINSLLYPFRSKLFAKFFYPIFKIIRLFILYILDRQLIK